MDGPNAIDRTMVGTPIREMSDPRILGEVDTPRPLRTVGGRVDVFGWCFQEGVPSSPAVRLRAGDYVLNAGEGLHRPDVVKHHAGLCPPKDCGFRIRGALPAGLQQVQFEARSADGIWTTFKVVAIDVEARQELHPPPTPDEVPRAQRVVLPRCDRRPPERTTTQARAALNVLFVIPGDFESNNALHVIALATHLTHVGHCCIIAAEPPLETLRTHEDPVFAGCTHDEARNRTPTFTDGRGPDIVHAWTTRENVRKVCTHVLPESGARLVIHLEDNEAHVLSRFMNRSLEELRSLPAAEAGAILPSNASHPLLAETFLASADSVTLIVDRLRDFVPEAMPTLTFWPAADERYFFPRPRPDRFRAAMGLGTSHTVLFYHGNVHPANVEEMRSLYEAVARLNETGTAVTLIRAGRNFCDFPGNLAARTSNCVLELGQIAHHRHLPELMALADFFVQPGEPDSFNNYRFPSKLPEFFAIGRPVILPRTNLGLSLEHGRNAFVLDKADASGITDAIRTLRADPILAQRLAEGAREFAAAHFSWPRSARLLSDFYGSVMARNGRRT